MSDTLGNEIRGMFDTKKTKRRTKKEIYKI